MLHDSFWQAIENNPGEPFPLLIASTMLARMVMSLCQNL
jgi:hypothetical protein